MKELLALPLNLAILSPAQTVNWDFVSDVVNSCNYVYRSPEQCQNHYIKTFVGAEGKVSFNCDMHYIMMQTCNLLVAGFLLLFGYFFVYSSLLLVDYASV